MVMAAGEDSASPDFESVAHQNVKAAPAPRLPDGLSTLDLPATRELKALRATRHACALMGIQKKSSGWRPLEISLDAMEKSTGIP